MELWSESLRAYGTPVAIWLQSLRPIDTGVMSEVECSSFSGRIPGVVDGLSSIFANANMPNLQEVEVSDQEAIEVTRR